MRYLNRTTIALSIALAACDSPTPPRGPGAIFITSSATISEPSAFFEYNITVDNGTPRVVNVFEGASYQLNGLAHGSHTVALSGVPSTCNAGQLVRSVTLKGDDTASVVFSISCPRTTGDVRVNVSTTGSDLDTDGYTVTLDQQSRGFVPSNGQTTLAFVSAGSHTVGLTGVATNCTASAAQSVSVAAGALATANFTVNCTAAAVVKLAVNVTGTDKDPDGVTLRLGAGLPVRTAIGTTHLRVAQGTQSWEIGDVQPNCTLGGAASGSITLAGGDTASITVNATCTAVGYGTATTIADDPAADTLPNFGDPDKAHDARQLTTRYAPNWLILVMRFTRPVGGVGEMAAGALQGFVELDVDENSSTGFDPIVNDYGGNAQQGVDYALVFFDADGSSIRIAKATATDTTTHLVPLAIEGDSVIVRIPLAKLGGDDGNLSITSVIGTTDRPTDILPNTGVILARQPASSAVASGVRPAARLAPQPAGAKRSYSPGWQ